MEVGGIKFDAMTFGVTKGPTSRAAELETKVSKTMDRRYELKDVMTLIKDVRSSIEDADKLLNVGSANVGGNKVKIASRTSVADDPSSNLKDITSLASVSAGSFTINGVSISVDPTSDSLIDIINRVNQSGAGASASFSTSTRQLVIRAQKGDTNVVLDAGTTNFLGKIGIDEGTHKVKGANQSVRRLLEKDEVKSALESVTISLNKLFKKSFPDVIKDDVDKFRDDLFDRVRKTSNNIADSPQIKLGLLETNLGFALQYDDQTDGLLEFKGGEYGDAAREDGDRLMRFLTQDKDGYSSDGLLVTLTEAMDKIENDVTAELGSTALFLRRWVV